MREKNELRQQMETETVADIDNGAEYMTPGALGGTTTAVMNETT